MKIAPFTKTYQGRRVLDFPGIELEKGRIYALIGANGSGKSTLVRIIAGIIPADKKGLYTDAKSLGYMPQKSYAFRLSTEANLMLNASARDKARAKLLMDRLQLSQLAGKKANRLSGGETARMALARLLMRPCELLILDEPTAAMDMESTALAEELIKQYAEDSGCTLLLVTHSLKQARRMADEVLFLHKGELLEQGESSKLLYRPDSTELRQFLDFYDM